MADFESCITGAVAAGGIKAEVAEAARATYREVRAALGDTVSPIDADRQAGDATLKALRDAAAEERRHRVLTMRTRMATLENLAAWKTKLGYTDVKPLGGGDGGKGGGYWSQGGKPPENGPYKGGRAAAKYNIELIDGQGGLAGAAGSSVKGRYQAIRGSFDSQMAAVFEKFESVTGFDRPGRMTLMNLTREVFGVDTGDVHAKALAAAWKETSERARQMFNEAGGSIGKILDWGMPQSHDLYSVLKAGKEAWVEFTKPLVDRARMVDSLTGAPFTEERLDYALGTVWDSIATKGAANRDVGDRLGIGMLAKRRQDERFLVFKDPDAWVAYQQQFGHEDAYAAMVNHLDSMARDIAQMQVLGPNPAAQFEWLTNLAEREARLEEAAGVKGAFGKAQSANNTAKTMYGLFRGELSTAYGVRSKVAVGLASIRAYLSGAQLGSAVINDVVSNPVFQAYTRAFTGMSKQGDFKAWASWVTSGDARQTARRSGFILQGSRAVLAGSTQDMLRAQTVGGKVVGGLNWFARRVPVAVYKASLLSPNMAASRWAFQHEFMGLAHDLRGSTLEALLGSANGSEREFGRTLQARGFTPVEWDQIRSTPPTSPAAGADFLSPEAIRGVHGDELAFRFSEMIERQTRLAIPEPSLWAQAHIVGESRPGTVWGELRRSIGSYRSFTVTQTYLWSRELTARGVGSGGLWAGVVAGHAAGLLTTLTLAGALGVQLRDMVKGNDPRDMSDPRFWGAAMLYGGGLGIVGDFFYSAQARNGKGSALTGMGAPAAAASDLWNVTGGLAFDVAGRHFKDGESWGDAMDQANPGRQVSRLVGSYSPLSSIWWARAAWQRGVAENLQRQLDPGAEEAFIRSSRGLHNDTGQAEWWARGAQTPDRAPDMGAAVGSPQP